MELVRSVELRAVSGQTNLALEGWWPVRTDDIPFVDWPIRPASSGRPWMVRSLGFKSNKLMQIKLNLNFDHDHYVTVIDFRNDTVMYAVIGSQHQVKNLNWSTRLVCKYNQISRTLKRQTKAVSKWMPLSCFLVSKSLGEEYRKGNRSTFREVISMHKNLTSSNILSQHAVQPLCLESFKLYRAIMDDIAEHDPEFLKVKFWQTYALFSNKINGESIAKFELIIL